jgi:hypothetical protein
MWYVSGWFTGSAASHELAGRPTCVVFRIVEPHLGVGRHPHDDMARAGITTSGGGDPVGPSGMPARPARAIGDEGQRTGVIDARTGSRDRRCNTRGIGRRRSSRSAIVERIAIVARRTVVAQCGTGLGGSARTAAPAASSSRAGRRTSANAWIGKHRVHPVGIGVCVGSAPVKTIPPDAPRAHNRSCRRRKPASLLPDLSNARSA